MKTSFFLTFILSYGFVAYAQVDSSKFGIFDNEKGIVKSNNLLKATSTNIKATPAANFNLSSENKINQNTINKNLEINNIAKKNILLESQPEDNDIIGLRYWKGKDVTHQKMSSQVDLGSLTTKSKTVKIECRDFGAIDGDRIKIFLNEAIISDDIGLKSNYFVIHITLKEGYNRIDFKALNEGLVGPNTAEISVYDEQDNLLSSKEWDMPTGYIATLGITKVN